MGIFENAGPLTVQSEQLRIDIAAGWTIEFVPLRTGSGSRVLARLGASPCLSITSQIEFLDSQTRFPAGTIIFSFEDWLA